MGAGPAGLIAAEEIARAGHPVIVADAMPTPARKFLMAGKSGLNLTKDEPTDVFASHVTGSTAPMVRAAMDRFGPAEAVAWAEGLGVTMFTGSTGRAFPVGMKASPLLRAWLARLAGLGVELRTRWRWQGFQDDALRFDTPDGTRLITPKVAVLALGGASWPRLGSDAAWVPWLRERGVGVAPFQPANMGFHVDWSPKMAALFGTPVKGTQITAGPLSTRGEWVVTNAGVEGGGIYEIAAPIRDGATAQVDLMPDVPVDDLARRLALIPARQSIGNRLRRVLGDGVKAALALEWGRPLPDAPDQLASRLKSLPMPVVGPMPIARAISSAGGITSDALDPNLRLRAAPNIFAAGEMLDWEAPTGGYLLTACLATGRMAGQAAARVLNGPD